MSIKKFLTNLLAETVKKLGVLGTISYVGSVLLFFVSSQINFNTDATKGWLLASMGFALLIFSGLIYWLESREETTKIKDGLVVLREVFNRLAEQTTKGTNEQAVSITMTINNLPDKIGEVIKKTSGQNLSEK